ncbi:hypothetical protein ACLMAJ_30115 [Nocardia sp. KC 131]|uniref:hypothetical protein n=1 Tax=Nocardia arseniciresistens TaxID=3392119 RepID=UPI00398E420F
MPKKVGGKLFYTAEEAVQLGLTLSQEEIAQNEKIFAEFEEKRRAAGPAPEGKMPGFGGRFSDDLEGTEFEGWTRDPRTDKWFDKDGRPAYDEDGRRITYND